MKLTDYYSILELPPSASSEEIKKAFRRLAQLYHPDKKNNDPYAAAQFAAIKEAYEILSTPVKKEYYLQQRWYAQSIGKKIKQETITPESVLKQSIELNQYVARLDVHRMDHQGLLEYIETILAHSTINTLNSFNVPSINKEIIFLMIKSGRVLPFTLAARLAERLKILKTNDLVTSEQIDQFVRRHKQTYYWEKRKVWIILLITLLICFGIYFISSK